MPNDATDNSLLPISAGPDTPVAAVDGLRVEAGVARPVHELLSTEAPLQITLNGRPFLITMRTPGHDEQLVRGLLFSDGIVSARARFRCELSTTADGLDVLAVTMPSVYLCEQVFARRATLASTSCGLCGQRLWEELPASARTRPPRQPLAPRLLSRLTAHMRDRQPCFAQTGGTHAAALFTATGKLLAVGEDIGRHNAVDKAIGTLVMRRALARAAILVVSGRISYELVAKVSMARVPVIAGVSAPTSLAVETGAARSIAVVGFCRDERATIYSHPEYFTLPRDCAVPPT